MNDSFLEDLGLMAQATESTHSAERYITTRQNNSPRLDLHEDFEAELRQNSDQLPAERLIDSKRKKKSANKLKIATTGEKTSQRQIEGKPVENVDTLGQPHVKTRREHQGDSRETSGSSDKSSKEPSRASGSGHRRESRGKDVITDHSVVAFLKCVKDVVEENVRVESEGIMETMMNLHIRQQSNMIKQLMFLPDDVAAISLTDGSPRFYELLNENSRLQENVAFLRGRAHQLEKELEVEEAVMQENLMLREKLRELEKQRENFGI